MAINKWGGITEPISEELLKEAQVEQKSPGFHRISSWSKYRSVRNLKALEKDAIYDSRVAYTLNWVLLKAGHSGEFFRQPLSRNKKMNEYTLSRQLELYPDKKANYLSGIHNYIEYIELLKQLSKKLWGNFEIQIPARSLLCSEYLFFTEMLLFAMADGCVVEDIKQRVEITIK